MTVSVSVAMRPERPRAEVVVRLLAVDDEPASADRALTDLVAAYLGIRVDQVDLGRHCPQCAGTDHGRPVVRPVNGHRVHVSIARTLADPLSGMSRVTGSVSLNVAPPS